MQDSRMSGFTIIALIAWLFGAIAAGYFGIEFLKFSGIAEILASVFLVFVLCMLFFGKFYFIGMFFAGLISGPLFAIDILSGIASLIAFFLAGTAGTIWGLKLYDDFHGKDNFYSKEHLQQSGLYLGTALIISIVPSLLASEIPKIGFSEIFEKARQLVGA